jgi:formylglycine-generating enzyme required for sulfatase activity
MTRTSPLLLAVAALLLSIGGGAARGAAQEQPPAAPKPVRNQDTAAGKPPAASAQDPAASAAPGGAGLLRIVPPRGKARIGMDRKELDEQIKNTDLGRMSNVKEAIEDEYSLSCPAHVVELPSYLLCKYETTNAQWARFLETAAKVVYTVPEKEKPGAHTLEEISRMHLLIPPFPVAGGGRYFPVANDWRTLYDLNEDVINPAVADQDPKARPGPEVFQKRMLPAGTKITCYRWSVPTTWKVKGKVRATPPVTWEAMPVTMVSLADAMAFCAHYGLHVPTEEEWEAAARGPDGEFWPEGGKELDPLAHAWKNFNVELMKAKPDAEKAVAGARKKVEDLKKAGSDTRAIAAAQAALDRIEWILAARELPDNLDAFPFVEVGLFPFGRSPAGLMDLIGNVDEWTSSPLRPYPGSDSKSSFREARAFVLRGGNVFDKDSVLTAPFRKFRSKEVIIGKHFKANTAGFRAARYEIPGASAASRLIVPILDSSPAILPRAEDRQTHKIVGPGLEVYLASGIARYDEVAWDAAGSPKSDPAGKVFWQGKTESLCVIPPTGTPFRDVAAVRKAAEDNPINHAVIEKKLPDPREPREMAFLGVLHMTEAMEFKGEILSVVEKEVPLSPEEIKALRDRWEAEQKAKKEKEEKDAKDTGGGDGGGEPKKMEGGKGGKGGDKGGKGGDKGGDKSGDPPADPADPNAPEEEKDDDKDKAPVFPKTKKVKVVAYKEGFLKGAYRPGQTTDSPTVSEAGLLFGLLRTHGELRPVFWEARTSGSVNSQAPGGIVMLEQPLVVLPKEAVEFRKIGRPPGSFSTFDATTGQVELTYGIPIEGKTDFIEVKLRLRLGDFPTDRPWVTLAPPAK